MVKLKVYVVNYYEWFLALTSKESQILLNFQYYEITTQFKQIPRSAGKQI